MTESDNTSTNTANADQTTATRKTTMTNRNPGNGVGPSGPLRANANELYGVTHYNATYCIGKQIPLNADGTLGKTQMGGMSQANYTVARLGPTGLDALLNTVGANDCLSFSLPVDGSTAGTVVSKRRFDEATANGGEPGGVIRSKENFDLPHGPGWIHIDHDPDRGGQNLDMDALLRTLDAVLGPVLGPIDDFDWLCRQSSSSMIYRKGADEPEPGRGTRGVHVYLGVQDRSQLNESRRRTLLALLAEAGLSAPWMAKNGRVHTKYIIDAAPLTARNGLCYVRPGLPEGFEQRLEETLVNETGQGVDLTLLDRVDYSVLEAADERTAEARAAMEATPEVQAAREAYDEARASTMVARGVSADVAKRTVAAGYEGKLMAEHDLQFDDYGLVTVRDVLADPAKYDGATLADPLEPEYGGGRNLAICRPMGVNPFIYSQAHGVQRFWLTHDARSLSDVIRGMDEDALRGKFPHLLSGFTGTASERASVELLLKQRLGVPVKAIRQDADEYARVNEDGLAGQARRQREDSLDSIALEWAFISCDNRFIEVANPSHTVSPQAFGLMYQKAAGGPDAPPIVQTLLAERGAIPVYSGVTYHPGAPLSVNGYLNTWRAPPEPGLHAGTPDLWLSLVHDMCGDESELVLDWLAFTVQRPGEKINYGLVLFSSREGAGKGTMMEPVRQAVGRANAVDVTNAMLCSSFGDWLMHSKLALMDEVSIAGKSDINAALKGYLCAPPATLQANRKGLSAVTMPNLLSVVIMTNDIGAVEVSHSSRRTLMIDAGQIPIPLTKDTARAARLWEWYADTGCDEVHRYLANRDISAFEHNKPPVVTELQRDMAEATKSEAHLAIDEWYEDLVGLAAEAPGWRLQDIMDSLTTGVVGKRFNRTAVLRGLHAADWVSVHWRINRGKVDVKKGKMWVPADSYYTQVSEDKRGAALFSYEQKVAGRKRMELVPPIAPENTENDDDENG